MKEAHGLLFIAVCGEIRINRFLRQRLLQCMKGIMRYGRTGSCASIIAVYLEKEPERIAVSRCSMERSD